jgi:hypothetical protein
MFVVGGKIDAEVVAEWMNDNIAGAVAATIVESDLAELEEEGMLQ